MISIAIIIPAYKSKYLEQTIRSIADQSDKNFHLYIGDDCSPDDLFKIIDSFKNHIGITYKRFDINLGRYDLVAHWNRCLQMIDKEEWFIIFSDDDLMEEDCIKNAIEYINNYDNDVFHFNLRIIDKKSEIIRTPAVFPDVISACNFFSLLYTYQIDARMPEFIFRKKHFFDKNGFVPFEMAMRTDNATVINCSFDKNIRTINCNNSNIRWRDSGDNLSSRTSSKEKNIVQLNSLIQFFNWMELLCQKRNIKFPLSKKQTIYFLLKEGIYIVRIIGVLNIFKIFKKSNVMTRSFYLIPSCFVAIIINKISTFLR